MNKLSEPEDPLPLQSPLSAVVAVAINGKRKSKYVVRWALENFIPEGKVVFKLIHVCAVLSSVPTPMGITIPITEVREDVAAAYRKEVNWQTNELLHPYKIMCVRRKVLVDVVVLESDDVASALAQEVHTSNITKLVIGASSPGLFSRKIDTLSSTISAGIPSFCTVYAISKGKLSSIRPSDMETNGNTKDDNSSQALSRISQMFARPSSVDVNHLWSQSLGSEEGNGTITTHFSSSSIGNIGGRESSLQSLMAETESRTSNQGSVSDAISGYSTSESQANLNFELEKLRIELSHVRGMYEMARSETVDASQKLNNLKEWKLEEERRLKEGKVREEMAKELARQEKEKYEAAKKELEMMGDRAEREALRRKVSETKAERDAREREKIGNALVDQMQQYQVFTWEEIVSATSSFSESLRMGMGAYGTVYKCSLHHTNVAIKVLHSKESQNLKQFDQELEILSKIRHPHLLLLIGACPDRGCLIYEYMENGSLEDRLLRKNSMPPIPWFDRFRIAWEVASALVFLHHAKPKPIIHRDLKPANILLDNNLVSKIGDVGLSTMLHADPSLLSIFKNTGPVGTLCYIDPEYQRTGSVSLKSDVYAFGIVMLQLLTSKPAIALTHMVERAISEGSLMEFLDADAGDWPPEETEELALLAVSCAELRRKDRPDLRDEVLPVLEKLKEVADCSKDATSWVKLAPPSHFICPISQDVMNDPYVAADGYTFDRRAIEKWLEGNDKSPMTNLPLPNKHLIPNYTLLSAIKEWKSLNQ
ncbi:hypothetical protein BT93_K2384 [Corymbia citriodora subsp. variegata]|nr:hypothetical protein BT93_K2384 [Corymbia citriodora subsp. variegata]